MMVLENEKCRIKIEIDKTYTINSADNRYYDLTLNPGQYGRNDDTTTFSIDIDLCSKRFSVALIGDFFSYDLDCAILEGDTLTVLQGNIVIQISIYDGSVIRCQRLDCFGCNFAIYRAPNGYVIYGETEITMLGFDLSKKWSFGGADIFASVSGKDPFKMFEDCICLYDFEDNFYKIDYDGKLLEERLM